MTESISPAPPPCPSHPLMSTHPSAPSPQSFPRAAAATPPSCLLHHKHLQLQEHCRGARSAADEPQLAWLRDPPPGNPPREEKTCYARWAGVPSRAVHAAAMAAAQRACCPSRRTPPSTLPHPFPYEPSCSHPRSRPPQRRCSRSCCPPVTHSMPPPEIGEAPALDHAGCLADLHPPQHGQHARGLPGTSALAFSSSWPWTSPPPSRPCSSTQPRYSRFAYSTAHLHCTASKRHCLCPVVTPSFPSENL